MNAQAAALVPAAIKSKTVIVAADATNAPYEAIGPDGHTIVGMDADFARALFPLMGLKFKLVNAGFDTIIPGLSSGKYGIGLSSFTDTKAREQVVNFVDYFLAGEGFFEKASNSAAVTSLSSICGLKVAVQSGTTEQADATSEVKKCQAAGKPADVVQVYPDGSSINLALLSGRSQIGFVDSPIAAYQVSQTHGRFKVVGQTFATAPYGIAVPKSAGTLDEAILAALKALIANGEYAKILTHWGVQVGADSKPTLNGATS